MNVRNWKTSFVVSAAVLCACFFATYFFGVPIFPFEKSSELNVGGDNRKETIPKPFSDSKKIIVRETDEMNPSGPSISMSKKEIIFNPPSNEHGFPDKTVEDILDDVVSPITVDFICKDPEVFGEYSRLLSTACELGTEDSVTELLDLGLTFLHESMLHPVGYEDAIFVLDFCNKIRDDLKTFEGTVSPEFMQIARFRVLLTEYLLPRDPRRTAWQDHEIARKEFYELAEMRTDDPVLERQCRYLLFAAQVSGMHRTMNENGVYGNEDYYNYYTLKEVLKFPSVGSDFSLREQITATKIDIAAKLEYARREFVSSSNDQRSVEAVTWEDETLVRYNETLAQYEEALTMLDSLAEEFKAKLNEGDKRYIAMLKQRAVNDRHRIPWRYTD